ncbi:MAG: FAD-dependent monooxygenase [Planctomycetota bacterium]
MSKRDILISGAGIGGASAAIALRRRGHDVIVFERSPQPREVGAGITLWPNALAALDRVGLAEPIRAAGRSIDFAEVRTEDGRRLFEADLRPLWRRFLRPGIGIHRGELLRILVEAVPEESLRTDSEVTGFDATAEGVIIFLASGEEIEGTALVGADGLHSTVRKQLHPDGLLRASRSVAWRGVVSGFKDAFGSDRTCAVLGRGLQAGVVPIGSDRHYWFICFTVSRSLEVLGDEASALFEERVKALWSPLREMIAASEPPHVAELFDREPIRSWGSGRVTLLGDAAHPTTPNLGQGACQALEDAVVLAETYRPEDVAASLRAYESRRFAKTTRIVRESRRMGRILQLENTLTRRLRDLAIRFLPTRWQTDRQSWMFETDF